MRISIWQQFSSNHSSHYTILGVFETAEKATEASKQLNHVLMLLAQDRKRSSGDESSEEDRRHWYTGTRFPIYLREHYGIEYCHPSLWLRWTRDGYRIFDRCLALNLFSAEPHDTHPFDSLLRHWGANVITLINPIGSVLYITIRCAAPNETTAQNLLDDVQVMWQEDGNPVRNVTIGGWFPTSDHQPSIRREGVTLHYPLRIYMEALDRVFRFIEYLQERGCTEIEYEFAKE